MPDLVEHAIQVMIDGQLHETCLACSRITEMTIENYSTHMSRTGSYSSKNTIIILNNY